MRETKLVDTDIVQLDAIQGAGEARNETYKQYVDMSTGAKQRSNALITFQANELDSCMERWWACL